ncbi:MAG: cell division protein SepF [Pseudonocardiales bacterium]|nr:MAG: cell division protein SepF [Pseudonocardiales bacterium]
MAGAMRKMGIYLGLVEDDEDHLHASDDYDDFDDYDEPPGRTSVRPVDRPTGLTRGGLALDTRPTAQARVETPTSVAAYRITTLHPRTYNEARTIGEHFREGVPVIMNLTEMDDSDAKRLVDFAAGLSFGLRGRIERITNKVFLLSPANVDVTAEDKARIAEGGFFNQS